MNNQISRYFCIVLFFSASIISLPAQNVIDQEIAQNIGSNVFEVVVNKVTSNEIQYAEELPYHLIPYQERVDEYISLGTAFAVGENEFLSAAHVFSLDQETLRKDFYLRDAEDNIYPVTEIIQYDNWRDYVQFRVDSIQIESPLIMQEETILNSTVFTVGNAQGSGIVIRPGLLTSRTYEDQEGAWKWLRYTAASSPGNSGGPLINERGEVLGIVTARSENENLNYALPISETLPLGPKDAFLRYNYYYIFPFAQGRYDQDSEFSIELPLELPRLREIATNIEQEVLTDCIRGFDEKYQGILFPEDIEGQRRITSQLPSSLFPFLISEKQDSTWSLYRPEDLYQAKIDEATLIYGQMDQINYWQLTGMEPEELENLFDHPKNLMDKIFSGYVLNRSVANVNIRMTSLGNPAETHWISDRWGRKWVSLIWEIPFSDYSLVLIALPTPEGGIGYFETTSYSNAHVYQRDFERMTSQISYYYRGKLSQWESFLQHQEWLPTFLSEMEISVLPSLSIDTTTASIDIDPEIVPLRPDTLLYILPDFRQTPLGVRLDFGGLYLNQQQNEGASCSLLRHYPPLEDAEESEFQKWQNMINNNYPYNGEPIEDDDRFHLLRSLQSSHFEPVENDPEFIWTLTWSSSIESSENEAERSYSRLLEETSISDAEWYLAYPDVDLRTAQSLEQIQGLTIFEAISRNRALLLREFVEKEVDLEALNAEGRTPLLEAYNQSKFNLARILLQANVSTEIVDYSGTSPLMEAIEKVDERYCLYLLEHITSPETLILRSREGYTPLMEAIRKDYFELANAILDRNIDINGQNERGRTAIYYALLSGDEALANRMLDLNPDLEVGEQSGFLNIHMALEYSTEAVAQRLLDEGAPLGDQNSNGWNALMYAARYQTGDIIMEIAEQTSNVNAVTKDGWSALHIAVRYNHEDLALSLLERGAAPDSPTNDGVKPLTLASQYTTLDVVQALVEAGADLTSLDTNRKDPLMLALRYENPEIASYLIESGAPLDGISITGWSTLALALRYSTPEVIEQLLDKGIPLDTFDDEDEWTELMLALKNSNARVASRLIQMGACHPDRATTTGWTELMFASQYNPEVVPLIIPFVSEIDAVNNKGYSALSLAAIKGFTLAVEALLEAGADPFLKDSTGGCAFSYAAEGSPECFEAMGNFLKDSNSSSLVMDKILFDDGLDLDRIKFNIAEVLEGGEMIFTELSMVNTFAYEGSALQMQNIEETTNLLKFNYPLQTGYENVIVTYRVCTKDLQQQINRNEPSKFMIHCNKNGNQIFESKELEEWSEWEYQILSLNLSPNYNYENLEFQFNYYDLGTVAIDDINIFYF